ncbi:hypothetical protein AAG593_08890 [Citromicrobium bathyomarinum]
MQVEVFAGEHGETLLFAGDFTAMPRIGETISRDAGGYFEYYDVTDVWYREDGQSGKFNACVSVKLND